MAISPEAIIEPTLLQWARTSAGLTTSQAANKVKVPLERFNKWETGEEKPTVNQLRILANAYKRPFAVFYLPEPPKDFAPIKEFRRFPGQVAGTESPNLRLEIRRAFERREIAIQLSEELGTVPPKLPIKAKLSDKPDDVAEQIRKFLKITFKEQNKLHDKYEALNYWRSHLEKSGVLVFQASKIEQSEMRGFSISQKPLPAIVLNTKDTPFARIFTMLHEFVHIVLEEGGLCDDFEHESGRPPEKQRVEIFCNRVAGSVLVPEKELLEEESVAQKGNQKTWSSEEISKLAKRFMISREVILRRLLLMNKTSKSFYQKMTGMFLDEYEAIASKPKKKIIVPYYRKVISYEGHSYISLVLNNYYQEKITTKDLSDFLGVKLRHLKDIEYEVMGKSTEFGGFG